MNITYTLGLMIAVIMAAAPAARAQEDLGASFGQAQEAVQTSDSGGAGVPEIAGQPIKG